MKLIKASYQILTPINGEEILKAIELAARTCYQSEGKIDTKVKCDNCLNNLSICPNLLLSKYCSEMIDGEVLGIPSYIDICKKLLKRNHEAMLEFGGMITVRFICDRGVSHELVRHRVASFAQESTRYCNYSKDEHISFIIPNWSDLEEKEWTAEMMARSIKDNYPLFVWMWAMKEAEDAYNRLLKQSWTPQQARSVLPNSLKTEINISANIREWRHIFKLRTAKPAHPQMRELMCPLLDEFKSKIPILFDDINY